MLTVKIIPVLNDNYIYLIHDQHSKQTAVVDPAVAAPVLDILNEQAWSLNYIFNTHHHGDHIGGNRELKKQTGCKMVAAAADSYRIPAIDIAVNHGDVVHLGEHKIDIIAMPGHTSNHIGYYFADKPWLFCGDTLFSMGCGRLFDGTAEQLWHSLQWIKSLPTNTLIYCSHEYTLANGKFALSLEPNNQATQQRIAKVTALRQQSQPSLPTILGDELATNPFLREHSSELQANIAMQDAQAMEIFIKLRQLKDHFIG